MSAGEKDVLYKGMGSESYYMKNLTSYEHTKIFCVSYSGINNKYSMSANNLHKFKSNNKSVLLQSLGLFKILTPKICKSAVGIVVTMSHFGLRLKAVNIKQ